jgi:lipoprotein NlpD
MNRASALLCGLAGVALTLAGCGSRPVQAPVIERVPPAAAKPATPRAVDTRPEVYTVVRGDTLFSIALDHGLDYKELAAWNNLDNPNLIRTGQQLRIKPPAGVQEAPVIVRPVSSSGRVEGHALPAPGPAKTEPARVEPVLRPPAAQDQVKSEPLARKLPYSPENVALLQRAEAPVKPLAPEPAPAAASLPKPEAAKTDSDIVDADKLDWGWPAQGKIIAGFSGPSNKGVDIGGRLGDPVFAAASGVVSYMGTGIPSLGKLIVIKHNNAYRSVYAHNREIFVKENQTVIKGQKIAELGDIGSDRPKLHFEIRHFGKPVDPARYLPAQ